jgi:hypothetical protein
MNSMVNFPSVHWALLWVEVLIERDLPLPLGKPTTPMTQSCTFEHGHHDV